MYIDVDEDQIVTLDFSSYNSSRILDQFKKWNDKKKVYNENDIKKIEESVDMLGDVTKGFEVEANVDEVYIDEDDLRDEFIISKDKFCKLFIKKELLLI